MWKLEAQSPGWTSALDGGGNNLSGVLGIAAGWMLRVVGRMIVSLTWTAHEDIAHDGRDRRVAVIDIEATSSSW